MKKIFAIFILFLVIVSCNGKKPVVPDVPVDTQLNYFKTQYHKTIAIFPTFKYLGKESIDIEKSIAYRDYYLWKDQRTGKYVLITVLRPKSGTLPQDYNWIDKDTAIFARGNIAAYDTMHDRPTSIINKLDGPLPECFVVAQEFYFNEKEVMYKALIVPDKMCSSVFEPVIQELNRVANMQ